MCAQPMLFIDGGCKRVVGRRGAVVTSTKFVRASQREPYGDILLRPGPAAQASPGGAAALPASSGSAS